MQSTVGLEKSNQIQKARMNRNLLDSRDISTEKGRITVFVQSKRVYVDTRVLSLPSFAGSGLGSNLAYQTRRVVVYEDVLDQEQREALEDSEALARSLGVELEVKDIGKSSVFTRILNYILRAKVPSKTPSISVSGEALFLLAKNLPEENDNNNKEEEYLTKLC
jgi:hypothetical protein